MNTSKIYCYFWLRKKQERDKRIVLTNPENLPGEFCGLCQASEVETRVHPIVKAGYGRLGNDQFLI